MQPGVPRPQNREPMSIGNVQRWVMSTLTATTIMHLAVGLVVAAAFSDGLDEQVGLLLIGAAFGIVAMVAALLIHQKSPLSTWLLLGLLPSIVGAWWIFLR